MKLQTIGGGLCEIVLLFLALFYVGSAVGYECLCGRSRPLCMLRRGRLVVSGPSLCHRARSRLQLLQRLLALECRWRLHNLIALVASPGRHPPRSVTIFLSGHCCRIRICILEIKAEAVSLTAPRVNI